MDRVGLKVHFNGLWEDSNYVGGKIVRTALNKDICFSGLLENIRRLTKLDVDFTLHALEVTRSASLNKFSVDNEDDMAFLFVQGSSNIVELYVDRSDVHDIPPNLRAASSNPMQDFVSVPPLSISTPMISKMPAARLMPPPSPIIPISTIESGFESSQLVTQKLNNNVGVSDKMIEPFGFDDLESDLDLKLDRDLQESDDEGLETNLGNDNIEGVSNVDITNPGISSHIVSGSKNTISGTQFDYNPPQPDFVVPGVDFYAIQEIDSELSTTQCSSIYKKGVFKNKEQMKKALFTYARNKKIVIRVRRSTPSRYEVSCKNLECDFLFRARSSSGCAMWHVTEFKETHTSDCCNTRIYVPRKSTTKKKDQTASAQRTCSLCHQQGHNRRRCSLQPKNNK